MGKRKSSKVKVSKGPPPKVEKVFDCPFCSHSKTIEVKMYFIKFINPCFSQRPIGKATLRCRICKVDYEKKINRLT